MSNIDRAFIDDLLSRIDIVDVIGEVVKLKKAGANHKGLCPFHSEKTPSFNVSSAKQFYHCFGCGASGDAIKFLREHEGLSFVDAVEKLASMANMEVPKNNKLNQEDMGLYEANKLALQFFINSLNKNKGAMDYLISRGIDTDMIKKFDIGYAADSWDSLKKYFYQNKFIHHSNCLSIRVRIADIMYRLRYSPLAPNFIDEKIFIMPVWFDEFSVDKFSSDDINVQNQILQNTFWRSCQYRSVISGKTIHEI